MKKKVIGIILGLMAAVMVVAAIFILNYSLGGRRNYKRIEETVASVEVTATPTPEIVEENIENEETEPLEEVEEIVRIDNPYKDYYLENEDMSAWLLIPDTNVDYPVMYTPEDEEFYLRKDFYGQKNTAGCLILDTDSSLDPLSTNLIIHGHNMRSGEMFGQLNKYEDEDYCKEHSTIYLYDKDRQHVYEVIAVFESKVYNKSDQVFKYYYFFNAANEEEFNDFYTNIKEMSLYDTGVEAEYGDHFITLSTCLRYVENGRFVIVAKEIESGDYYLPIDGEESTDSVDKLNY